MIVNHCVHWRDWRVKICAIGKPFIDACLVIMTNNNRCLFSSQGSFALSKMLIYPALQSTKQHSMAYADVKHSENPLVVFVWPYRGDQQLFVLWSSTQNAIRRLWGRGIYGKRLHSQNDVLSEEKKLTLINCSRWSIPVFEILKYW